MSIPVKFTAIILSFTTATVIAATESSNANAAHAASAAAHANAAHATPAAAHANAAHATPAAAHASAAHAAPAAAHANAAHATPAAAHANAAHATPAASHVNAAHATPAASHANAATGQAYHSANTYYSRNERIEFEEKSFYETFIKGKVHVGASFTKSKAKEITAPAGTTYLGNLDDLREEDLSGIGFNIQYDLCDYVALAFANDMHVEHAVWNKPTEAHPYESTDGNLILDGMLYQVILQCPFRFYDNAWALTPYVGVGITDIKAKWEYANWWHYGWSSPADYAYYGNGSTASRKGNSRWMVLEEPSSAFTFTAGLSLQILAHLDLDFFYRMVSVDDIEAKFHRRKPTGPVEREGSFPAEFSTIGFGLRYVF